MRAYWRSSGGLELRYKLWTPILHVLIFGSSSVGGPGNPLPDSKDRSEYAWAVDPSRDPYWLAVGGPAAYCQLVPFECQSAERLGLESTGEEIPHRIRRLPLHGGRDVGVGVQGEAGGVMAQYCGERLPLYPVLQRRHGECVPLWHNKDKSETRCGATG